MAQWFRLSMMALILLAVWGCAKSSSLEGQGPPMAEVNPLQTRFTKANDGVITDRVTGLEWYVGPNQDNNWHQAKAWTENLTVAGGGWRLPTVAELKAIYQKGASPTNMDPIFQTTRVWVWSGQMDDARTAWGFAFYSGLVNSHGLNYGYGRLAFAVRSRR
ncbi:MAG: DUF1566 domain-containing protein [Deltaproteobacteria bacterium]|nr:DUF1566 domain-containing protein [Deltaproteobacteria bacterium]